MQNFHAALRLRALRKYYARQIVQCFFCNFANVLSPGQKPCQYRQLAASNLLRDFATQVMQLNLRLRIMSQEHIRSKVKIFLQNEKINENDEVILPFNRVEWARYLYTDRTALAKGNNQTSERGYPYL